MNENKELFDNANYYVKICSQITLNPQIILNLLSVQAQLVEALEELRNIVQGVLDEIPEEVRGYMDSFTLQIADAALSRATQEAP